MNTIDAILSLSRMGPLIIKPRGEQWRAIDDLVAAGAISIVKRQDGAVTVTRLEARPQDGVRHVPAVSSHACMRARERVPGWGEKTDTLIRDALARAQRRAAKAGAWVVWPGRLEVDLDGVGVQVRLSEDRRVVVTMVLA